jgi:hypothetical protein
VIACGYWIALEFILNSGDDKGKCGFLIYSKLFNFCKYDAILVIDNWTDYPLCSVFKITNTVDEMAQPLMPLATAIWLIDNTALTFEQIAEFCSLHSLEVSGIADGEIATHMKAHDPILSGELTKEEIERCEQDKDAKLEISVHEKYAVVSKKKRKGKYIPIAKRRDKPDAISWIVKNHPEIPDYKIVKLIGTTKNTIEMIRKRTHSNIQEITPKDPVILGLCKQAELDLAIETSVAKVKAESVKA